MKQTFPLLLVLFAAGCAFVPTSPEVRYTTVVVSVVDEGGTAVPGARVEAWGGVERTARRNVAQTEAQGQVHFVLPPADYQVYGHPPAGYDHVGRLPETRASVSTHSGVSPISVTLVLARIP